ncbi:MAG: SMC-Scp complex subunit ScpB [Nanoarchaeota archaeon]|nr:SMC-Scp complex subunit ScpB [Nanoarchaeota archaeon]
MSEVSNQIEALLFSGGRAMAVDDIAIIIGIDKKDVKKGLKELHDYYNQAGTSLMITQEGDFWKLNIKEKYVSLVTKIIANTEMGKSVTETLSVIAWKSPVLQSEVINIRTSKAYEHIKELTEAGFINKNKEGRSYRLRVTGKFFEYFDIPGNIGIKEAFKTVNIPKKEEPKKLDGLEIVKVDNNSEEHGRTKEIFDNQKEISSESEVEEVVEEKKKDILPIDKEFLEKINKQIDEIAAKNDELENDELFKNRRENVGATVYDSDLTSQEDSLEENDAVEDLEEESKLEMIKDDSSEVESEDVDQYQESKE